MWQLKTDTYLAVRLEAVRPILYLDALNENRSHLQGHLAYLTKTKGGKTLRSSTIYILDDAGTARGIFSINYDITLILSEEKIRAIQFLNDSGAFLITKAGDEISKFLGYPNTPSTITLMRQRSGTPRNNFPFCGQRNSCLSPIFSSCYTAYPPGAVRTAASRRTGSTRPQ